MSLESEKDDEFPQEDEFLADLQSALRELENF